MIFFYALSEAHPPRCDFFEPGLAQNRPTILMKCAAVRKCTVRALTQGGAFDVKFAE